MSPDDRRYLRAYTAYQKAAQSLKLAEAVAFQVGREVYWRKAAYRLYGTIVLTTPSGGRVKVRAHASRKEYWLDLSWLRDEMFA